MLQSKAVVPALMGLTIVAVVILGALPATSAQAAVSAASACPGDADADWTGIRRASTVVDAYTSIHLLQPWSGGGRAGYRIYPIPAETKGR